MKRAELYTIRLFVLIIIWNFIRIFLIKTLDYYNSNNNNNELILFDKFIKLINPQYNHNIKYSSNVGKNVAMKYLDIVYILPWYFLITLGCYCLGKLG